jgi:hypothetical protein
LLCRSLPTLSGGFFGDLGAPFWRHAIGARFPALQAPLAPQSDSGRVFALFLWRQLTVCDLSARDVHNKLSGLAKIAGALGMLLCYPRIMKRARLSG